MDNPEVIFLRPLHAETKREVALQCLMVEFGIDFAFSDAHELPGALPDDLSGVKAVAMDGDSAAGYRQGLSGERIGAFARSGGVVFEFWGPSQFNAIDEDAVRGGLDMLIASADLTMNHPRLRRRLQSRSFDRLYRELREPYFMSQVRNGLAGGIDRTFAEPYAYNILEAMEQFHEYDPAHGWDRVLRETLDGLIALSLESVDTLDRTTGLPVFVRMSRRTGAPVYAELAERTVRRVLATYPRIGGVAVLQPLRDRILWNECLAHFPPACAAVGEARGDKALVNHALHTARVLHDLNFEPSKSLWYHWGAPGQPNRRGPAVWARGQAWALVGLVGILRHLRASHPGRAELLRYVAEIVDGLNASQNDEGLWHNVMDEPRSRVCCRASGMFGYLLAECRQRGWADAGKVDALLHRAWRGLRGRIWRDRLCTNCCGTGAGATYQHYLSRPMLNTGASTVLRAGAAYTLAFGKEAAQAS